MCSIYYACDHHYLLLLLSKEAQKAQKSLNGKLAMSKRLTVRPAYAESRVSGFTWYTIKYTGTCILVYRIYTMVILVTACFQQVTEKNDLASERPTLRFVNF